MTKAELNKRAEQIGIPYNFGLFERDVEPPHLVAHYEEDDNTGADNKVYFKSKKTRIELTVEEQNEDLEKKIEEKIFYDTYYEKQTTDIASEHICNVSYYFNLK